MPASARDLRILVVALAVTASLFSFLAVRGLRHSPALRIDNRSPHEIALTIDEASLGTVQPGASMRIPLDDRVGAITLASADMTITTENPSGEGMEEVTITIAPVDDVTLTP